MNFQSFSKKGLAFFLSALFAGSVLIPGQADAQSGNDELSIEDLEAIINLPASARLKRESDEDPGNPRNLLNNQALRNEYLGLDPRFVYIPDGVDPLIIPWIRNQIVAGELLDDSQEAFQRAKETMDIAAARRILDTLEELTVEYPDAPQIPEAQVLDEEVREWVKVVTDKQNNPSGSEGGGTIISPGSELVVLPTWIRTNTTGVILDSENPDNSVVLVGDFILKPGESLLDRYAGVSVKEIASQRVTYEYNNRDFVVIVESN